MARSLSVKIPTADLIADIEASLAQIEKDIAEYPAKKREYLEASEAHKAEITRIAIDALTNRPELIGDKHDSVIRVYARYNSVTIDINDPKALGFPEAPVAPEEPNRNQSFGRDYTTKKQLLEKNLKVLKMAVGTQEFVNASTYNTVIDLL